MHITGITLSGFKSFAETTTLPVDSGLSVVIGPNGCGKSNIIEAVRWVMGEGSAKRLRGAEMEDVIFAGTRERRRRQSAEVSVTLDNAARTAPPPFQDAPEIVVSRRIERGQGSCYRINNQDVRARDVQMLFADLSIGSRSASIISQGEAAELVEHKPDARRLLLEEAAGVRGLHARRHDAELKLAQTATNLQRVSDILERGQNELAHLESQARATQRYREVMARKRRYQALYWWVQDRDVEAELQELQKLHHEQKSAHQAAVSAHNTATIASSRAETALLEIRQQDTALGERVQEAWQNWQNTERKREKLEDARTHDTARIDELRIDQETLEETLAQQQIREAELAAEKIEIHDESQDHDSSAEPLRLLEHEIAELETQCQQDQAHQAEQERAQMRAQEEAHSLSRQRTSLSHELQQATDQQHRLKQDLAALPETAFAEDAQDFTESRSAAEAALQTAYDLRMQKREHPKAMIEAKAWLDTRSDSVAELRRRLKTARRGWQTWQEQQSKGLVAEWAAPPELARALEAGLGFGLTASLEINNGYYWQAIAHPAPDFPKQIPSLWHCLLESGTTLPAQWQFLAEPLAWIGLVQEDNALSRLAPLLQPGQSLVTREGSGIRWDGLGFGPDSQILDSEQWAEGQRAEELASELQQQESACAQAQGLYEQAEADWSRQHQEAEAQYQQAREARDQLERQWQQAEARRKSAEITRQAEQAQRQRLEVALAANTAQLERLSEQFRTVENAESEAAQALFAVQSLTPEPEVAERQQKLELLLERCALLHEEQIRHQALREATLRTRQQQESEATRLAQQRTATEIRLQELQRKKAELQERCQKSTVEYDALQDAAVTAEAHWKKQDVNRQDIAQKLQEAVAVRDAATSQQQRLDIERTQHRETLLRTESNIEHKTAARTTLAEQAKQAIDESLAELAQKYDFATKETAMSLAEVNNALAMETRRLDNLGEVNLRADSDAREKRGELETLGAESADIQSAIDDLHSAIATLNDEGRTRLQATFKGLQGLFAEHFKKLFSGGEAELVWLETDDPIAPGIDIRARPPGKAMQSVHLLSGGEKSMTALALIGAVLRLRPTPICLLDEVDAALDDANVARFCSLLAELAASNPDMRFIVITHHRLSMAKADHLMGVGMPERGVSRLYGVDMLEAATGIPTPPPKTR